MALIKRIKAHFETRPRRRDSTLKYLIEIYKAVRKHRSWIESEIDRRLERVPRTDDVFAQLIEVTSDLNCKLRWKYAKVLQIADDRHIHSSEFRNFVERAGGFNKVIERHRAKMRKFGPIGVWS
jgi:hypothetical protein